MIFKIVPIMSAWMSVLFVTAIAVAEDTESLRLPEPEEVADAFYDGLIDYPEYQELLEIIMADSLTAEDSLYLSRFPDLLTGQAANQMFTKIPAPEPKRIECTERIERKEEFLFRQYQRLRGEGDAEWLFRFSSKSPLHRLQVQGENDYSGDFRWNRRSLILQFPKGILSATEITVGNFRERFGLGVIYGYHGRLLAKPAETDAAEEFLFPAYGGSNGVCVKFPGARSGMVVFDYDRNEDMAKRFLGASFPVRTGSLRFDISGGYGQLKNRRQNETAAYPYLSAYLKQSGPVVVEADLALAGRDEKGYLAVAGKLTRTLSAATVSLTGWHYGQRFPTFFSGGVSSHRSRTLRLDEIDLSYTDRQAGESGASVQCVYGISHSLRLQSGFGYADRGGEDNRLDGRLEGRWAVSETNSVRVNGYWRQDKLGYDGREQRQLTMEFSRRHGSISETWIVGYRFDRSGRRNDYLAAFVGEWKSRVGEAGLTIKLDRLDPDDLYNRYAYLVVSYRTDIGAGLMSSVRYSHRYRRDSQDGSYGIFRWELTGHI